MTVTPNADAVFTDQAAGRAGLSSAESARRLKAFGPNAVEPERVHPLRSLARHFWAPVPWMLEITIAVQLVIGERLEALMIATLLLLNVGLGLVQEGRASAALALLRRRLSLSARVHRDTGWVDLPVAELVPGDIVQISLGTVVPADGLLLGGHVLVDHSMLTGESVPDEKEPGQTVYAGGLVRRGEAVAEITATGKRTYFGRTAELVRAAHVESAEQKAVLAVVRNLTVVNATLIVAMIAYAFAIGLHVAQMVPLVLAALLSAVPVALPATFTLAAAVGARALAAQGVLLTRLSALQEAATIDVLCADKTGTLTANTLAVSAVRPVRNDASEQQVLAYAAMASSAEGTDPIDSAIRTASMRSGALKGPVPTSVQFTPFDPATKLAQATFTDKEQVLRVVKGAPAAVAALVPTTPEAAAQLESLTHAGYRTLAVAAGPPRLLTLVGFVAFSDPPRPDSAGLLSELRSLGVRTIMVTGDAAETAAAVARAIGLEGNVCPAGQIPQRAGVDDYAVYAGVFPEEKFRLVQALQRGGHAIGMCGDGANDAPALRQAQMGIAVSSATDVAKASAGIVLTEPGLGGIVTCIKEGRSAFQRVMTYTLTLLINKCATLLVIVGGLVMIGQAVLTPRLQALSMLASDFVTMSRAADRARPSPYPNAWRVHNLVVAAIPLGLLKLSYCLGVLAVGWHALHLAPTQMQALTVVMLVFAGQANVYVMREHGHFWHSRPAPIMAIASTGVVLLLGSLAASGVLMTKLPLTVISGLFLTTVGLAFATDWVKTIVLARVPIDRR